MTVIGVTTAAETKLIPPTPATVTIWPLANCLALVTVSRTSAGDPILLTAPVTPAEAPKLQRTAEWVGCGRGGTLTVGGQSMAGGPARRRTGGPNSPRKARGP